MLLRITKIWWRATLSHKNLFFSLTLLRSCFLTKLIFRVWFWSVFRRVLAHYCELFSILYCIRCLWWHDMTIDKHTPCKSSRTLDSLTTTLCVFSLCIVGNKKKFMLKIFVLFKILHRFIARIKAKTVFNIHKMDGRNKEWNI